MIMLNSLSVIVSVAMVGQAMGASVNIGHDLIAHPPLWTVRKLDIEEVQHKLETNFNFNDDEAVPFVVADMLYRCQGKDSSEIVQGLTVSKLIAQNHVELTDCSKQALKERHAVVEKGANVHGGLGINYPIHAYLLETLLQAASFCVQNKDAVVQSGINDEEYLRNLAISIQHEGFSHPSNLGRDHERHSYWAAEAGFNGVFSNIGKFIETESNRLQPGFNRYGARKSS